MKIVNGRNRAAAPTPLALTDGFLPFQLPDIQAIAQNAFNGAAAQLGANIWQDKSFISDNTGLVNLLPNTSLMAIAYTQPWTIASHPIETNAVINDHKFRQQRTVSVELIVNNAYLAATNVFIDLMMSNVTTLYSIIQDNVLQWDNLTIENYSIKRDPKKYDVSQITLTFKELMFARRKLEQLDASDTAKERDAAGQKKSVLAEQNMSGTDTLEASTIMHGSSMPPVPQIPSSTGGVA